MGKEIVDILYFLMLFLNAIIFVPQAYRLYKTKNSRHLSLITFLGFNILQVLAIINGIIYHDPAQEYGMIPSVFTCGAVVFLIVLYRVKPEQ